MGGAEGEHRETSGRRPESGVFPFRTVGDKKGDRWIRDKGLALSHAYGYEKPNENAILFSAMNLVGKDRREVGAMGENAACEYLRGQGFEIIARNVARKTGELDVIARKGSDMRFVEVKSLLCKEFPDPDGVRDEYDPSMNLHPMKIRKVARTAEWYVAEKDWEGDWQVDGCLVWLRERDGHAWVEYLPQIV